MEQAINWILTVLAIATAAFQFAYHRWEAFFLAWNRVKFFVLNPTALWNVEVDFAGQFTQASVRAAVRTLRSSWSDARLLEDRGWRTTLQGDGIVVSVELDPESDPETVSGHLVVRFHDVRSTFRESRALVDQIGSVVEQLNKACKAHQVKHGARIRFPSTNPYFGLYTQRVNRNGIDSFQCVFHPFRDQQSSDDSTVIVGRDTVSLTSSNTMKWASLSKKYLAVR